MQKQIQTQNARKGFKFHFQSIADLFIFLISDFSDTYINLFRALEWYGKA